MMNSNFVCICMLHLAIPPQNWLVAIWQNSTKECFAHLLVVDCFLFFSISCAFTSRYSTFYRRDDHYSQLLRFQRLDGWFRRRKDAHTNLQVTYPTMRRRKKLEYKQKSERENWKQMKFPTVWYDLVYVHCTIFQGQTFAVEIELCILKLHNEVATTILQHKTKTVRCLSRLWPCKCVERDIFEFNDFCMRILSNVHLSVLLFFWNK